MLQWRLCPLSNGLLLVHAVNLTHSSIIPSMLHLLPVQLNLLPLLLTSMWLSSLNAECPASDHPFLDSFKTDRDLTDLWLKKALPSVIKVLEFNGYKSSICVLNNRFHLPPESWPSDKSHACTELEQLICDHCLSSGVLYQDQTDILTVLILFEMYPTALRLLKLWLKT